MAITTRQGALANASQGKGVVVPVVTAGSGASTAANSSSGNISLHVASNAIGSVIPTSLQDLAFPAGLPSPTRLLGLSIGSTSGTVAFLARFYKIGTLDLTATGNKFTHDAATFPILKNQMGASSALNLIPVMYISTATATTAPQLTLATVASGAGYVNQDGNNVVGTKNWTAPATNTAGSSAFILTLEDGDSAVRDVTQIDVTVASAAGAATIYGMEPYCMFSIAAPGYECTRNLLVNPPSIPNIAPGVATSGTASSFLAIVPAGFTATSYTMSGYLWTYTE